MTALLQHATTLAANVADHAIALMSTAWPRSLAALELARLIDDGCTMGTTCDVDFSLSFDDPTMAEQALPALASAGFRIDDRTDARGFVVVRTPVCLRAYDLSRLTSRLDRAARAVGGFAALIGPSDSVIGSLGSDARAPEERPLPVESEIPLQRRAS